MWILLEVDMLILSARYSMWMNRVLCTTVDCGSEDVHFEYLILAAEVGGRIFFKLFQRVTLWMTLLLDLLILNACYSF